LPDKNENARAQTRTFFKQVNCAHFGIDHIRFMTGGGERFQSGLTISLTERLRDFDFVIVCDQSGFPCGCG
jgi:hypothetical protein